MQLIKSLISWVLLVAWAPSRCWKEWNKNCLIDDNNFLSARASAYKRIIVILLVNDDKYLPLLALLLCFFLFFYGTFIILYSSKKAVISKLWLKLNETAKSWEQERCFSYTMMQRSRIDLKKNWIGLIFNISILLNVLQYQFTVDSICFFPT